MRREATLIHGTASTASHTWERSGWLELLEDAEIAVALFPLPGHAGSTLPASAPLKAVVDALLDTARDSTILIGFSAGATLALHAALAAEGRITTLVLLGLGDGFWSAGSVKPDAAKRMRQGATDAFTRLMSATATSAGNTVEDVATFIEAAHSPPPLSGLSAVSARTLIICGTDDAAGPVTGLTSALPEATVLSPVGLDHFRTTSSREVMTAVMRFLQR